jgi:hypothetical protein
VTTDHRLTDTVRHEHAVLYWTRKRHVTGLEYRPDLDCELPLAWPTTIPGTTNCRNTIQTATARADVGGLVVEESSTPYDRIPTTQPRVVNYMTRL